MTPVLAVIIRPTATAHDGTRDGLSEWACWLQDVWTGTTKPCDIIPQFGGGVDAAIDHLRRHIHRLDVVDPSVIPAIEMDRGWLDRGEPPSDGWDL